MFPEICGEPFKGAVVNHLDENPENNAASNLRWTTVGDNNRWGTAIERRRQTLIEKGYIIEDAEERHQHRLEYDRKYREKNRERIREYYRKYRAKKKGN